MTRIKSHIRIIYLICFFLFILNKAYVRKLVFQGKLHAVLETISYSIPNFFEAVMGTSMVVAILLIAKSKSVKFLRDMSHWNLKIIGIAFSTIFVITQELKIHNFGGRNVYDFNDLIASVIGLLFIAYVILKYGVMENVQDDEFSR